MCVCVCVWERERESGLLGSLYSSISCIYVFIIMWNCCHVLFDICQWWHLEVVMNCLSEMWWRASCGVSLFCCRSSDNISGGPAAHSDPSLWFERVSVISLAQPQRQTSSCVWAFSLFFLLQTRKRNFGISYLSRNRSSAEVYLSLMSDWDLDVAFVSAANPYLLLKMDIKPSEDSKNTSLFWNNLQTNFGGVTRFTLTSACVRGHLWYHECAVKQPKVWFLMLVVG